MSVFAVLLFGCSPSRNKGEQCVIEQHQDSIELRKSIHMSKCYAYHLIANDSVKEGIHILDSLWQTYHLDDMIPCGIGTAYYKQGECDSAFYWFQVSEAYIDSMIVTQPSEKWLRDKLPLAYILRGKEAALEVEKSMSEESKEQAHIFCLCLRSQKSRHIYSSRLFPLLKTSWRTLSLLCSTRSRAMTM